MKSILDEAKELANAHRKTDLTTKIIKFFPEACTDQICLLEVASSAPTTGEVMPFTFPSDVPNGISHPSTVILLSPDEWEEVQSGHLPLPPSWDISTAEDM